MPAAGLAIAFLIIIVCSIYLYEDSKKRGEKIQLSEEKKDLGSVIKVGLTSGLLIFLLLIIILSLFPTHDIQDCIIIGISIICAVLCGCTTWIVETLKKNK